MNPVSDLGDEMYRQVGMISSYIL